MLTEDRPSSVPSSAVDSSFPVTVHEALHTAPSPRVRYNLTKFMLVQAGTSILSHASGATEVTAGDIVLLPAGHWYSGNPIDTVKTTTAYIDTRFLHEQERWLPALSRPALFQRRDPGDAMPAVLHFPTDRFLLLGSVLQHLNHVPSDRSNFYRLSLVAEFLDLVTQPPRSRHPHNEIVQAAITLLATRLDHAWTVHTLAEAVSLSPSQLTRLFQKHLSASPAAYLRAQRAQRMAELLESTTDPIDTVACKVGWPDPSHASHSFRSVYGVSPQHYRRAQNLRTLQPERQQRLSTVRLSR